MEQLLKDFNFDEETIGNTIVHYFHNDKTSIDKLEKYEYYKKMLNNVGDLKFGTVNNYSTFVPFRFYFLTSYKKKLMNYLEKNLIQTRSFFFPLHKQPQLKKYKNGGCKVTESLYKKGICLTIHNKISKKDIIFICNKIKTFFKE